MAKALKVAAEVVGAVVAIAAAIPTGGTSLLALGLGVSTATAGLIAAGVGLAASLATNLLSRPPSVSQSGNQDKFTASLDQGVPIAFGRTAVAGFIVHRQTWDWAGSTPPNAFQTFYGVWSGAGPIKGIEAFQVNSATVGFTGDITQGEAAVATGSYNDGHNNGWMWLQARLGHTPEPAALRATGFYPYPAGWSASAKLSGYAAFAWTLKFDGKGNTYPGGVVPQPRAILDGVLAWDPRHDDTYPGGAGPQRRDDPTTWGFTENPFVLALQWARGWWENGKRVMGIGMALAAIDVPSAVYAANIADANGWKAGGVAYSTDGKWEVLKKLCMAGSGEPLQLGGTLSCLVDTPRVSLATITDDDIIGRCTVPGAPRMVDRINGCIPTYREETQDWQLVPAAKVSVPAYVAADGKSRSKAITWELVQQVAQVGQLAAYAICNSREIDGVVLPLKLRWIGYKPGDALTIASSTVGMDNQLVVVRKRHLDPATAAVTVTARTETTGKHAFALGQTTTPPPSPALQAVDLSQLIQPGLDAAWSRVADDNGARPQDHATVGAPAGTNVGDREAAQLVSDLDINAAGILSQALRQDDAQTILDARTFVDGQPVSTVFRTFRDTQTTTNTATQSSFDLLGAKTADGTGWVLNGGSVQITPGKTLVQNLSDLGAANGQVSAKVSHLESVTLNPDGTAIASYTLSVQSGGVVAGIRAASNGAVSSVSILASRFAIVDDSTGTPVTPFSVIDGKVYATNFTADSITYGALVDKFAGDNQHLDPNGWYQKLPGGMIMQGGRYRANIGSEIGISIVFPIPFPNQVLSFGANGFNADGSNLKDLWLQNQGEPTLQGASFYTQAATHNAQNIDGFDWWAWGR